MRIPVSIRVYLRRFGSRRTVAADLKAGVTLGIESVPDGLAAGVLAGMNPLFGLNAYLVGTLAGALATGSVFMTVQATGALAVIIEDVPQVHGPDGGAAMATLTVMAGLIMLGLGIARLGSLVRFIPNAVLIGFVNAVAVNIVLGQLSNFTGFDGEGSNRLTRAFDTVLGLSHYSWPAVLVGVFTVGAILLLERTPLGALSLVVAVVAGSLLSLLFPEVATIGDISDAPPALPGFSLPDASLAVALVIPAAAIALVGLVQGAAISGSIPNPDGRYPEASADFRGQGIANIAAGMLQGMPVGGSMSGTALVRAAGAKTALANLVAGVVMIVTILLFSRFVGYIAMPTLAGLLILVGVRTFKLHRVLLVWRTGVTQIAVFLVTFVLTLVIPLQYAVIAGVGLSVILHVARQSNRVRVTQWTFEEDSSRPTETPAPATINPGETVVLCPYGSLFFASAPSFRAQLPTPSASRKTPQKAPPKARASSSACAVPRSSESPF
ncbi:MAG: SulP family inorganic anion transporter [Leucobacter sp.]